VRPFAQVGLSALPWSLPQALDMATLTSPAGSTGKPDVLPGMNAGIPGHVVPLLAQARRLMGSRLVAGVPAAVVDEHVKVMLPAGAADTVNDEPGEAEQGGCGGHRGQPDAQCC